MKEQCSEFSDNPTHPHNQANLVIPFPSLSCPFITYCKGWTLRTRLDCTLVDVLLLQVNAWHQSSASQFQSTHHFLSTQLPTAASLASPPPRPSPTKQNHRCSPVGWKQTLKDPVLSHLLTAANQATLHPTYLAIQLSGRLSPPPLQPEELCSLQLLT